MYWRLLAIACLIAFAAFSTTARLSFAEEGCKTAAAKPAAEKPATTTYKCDKTGKTWTQPAGEKKACPECGATAPNCGTQVKAEGDNKTVWSCRMHKSVCEEKAGRCKTCNLKLVEVPASSVTKKKAGKSVTITLKEEAEACEPNE